MSGETIKTLLPNLTSEDKQWGVLKSAFSEAADDMAASLERFNKGLPLRPRMEKQETMRYQPARTSGRKKMEAQAKLTEFGTKVPEGCLMARAKRKAEESVDPRVFKKKKKSCTYIEIRMYDMYCQKFLHIAEFSAWKFIETCANSSIPFVCFPPWTTIILNCG